MSVRRTSVPRFGRRAGLGAVGVAAAGLFAGACSVEVPGPQVTGAVVTATSMVAPVPGTDGLAVSGVSAEGKASAGVANPGTTAGVLTTEVSSPAPSTTEVPVPTSTWVVFEEVEEPLPPKVFDTVRIPQGAGDDTGAMYWYRESSEFPGQPPKRFEHAGAVFDQCRIEDAYFGTYGWYPNADGVPGDYRRDWFRSFAPGDCRGPGLAESQPLLDIWPERYFTFDDSGSKSPSFSSPQQAAEWYANEVAEYGEDSIPAGMTPAGSLGGLGDSIPHIDYSDAADTVDEVQVLPGTVAVGADGILRGLVRNWSRTLWAYGVVVKADGLEWAWPLSIQPGETAPFEIEAWHGPTDPAPADFSVTAEMSNDADLSRAWWGRWDWQYYQDESQDGDRDPDFDHYIYDRLNPISHPLGDAEWAPTLALDLAVYWAELSSEGAVVEVAELEFHEYGPSRDIADFGDRRPQVRWYYPRADSWTTEIGFLVPLVRLDPPRREMSWIGMPHPRADR